MKYKGKLVKDFSVAIAAGGQSSEDVVKILEENNILWDTCEAVVGDLIIITPVDDTLESVNTLFVEISKCFKASIHVLYEEFDSNGHNLEEFNEVLDANLLELMD